VTNDQMRELARLGAQARLQAIDEERSAILRAFPVLGSGRMTASNNGSSAPLSRRRKGMSPAQRRMVGERMKAYWAKRRRENAGITGSATDGASDTSSAPAKRKRGMSTEGRKSQGERMRVYSGNRRAKKDGTAAASREIAADASSTAANQAPRHRGMSPAARKAQCDRMRAYWAAKRARKAGAAGADAPARDASSARKNQKTARKK
jgi:hypothetical protein